MDRPSLQKLRRVSWDDLRIVASIATAGSLKNAAKTIGMTESTVSRALGRVEKLIGTILFHRAPKGAAPTHSCRKLLSYVENAQLQIAQGLEETAGRDSLPAGRIRLTAVPVVTNQILVPALTGFIRKYPDISLSLVASPLDISVLNGDMDIAVRMARPNSDFSAITFKIGSLKYAVYCAGKFDKIRKNKLPWLAYEDQMKGLPQACWIDQQCSNKAETKSPIRINDAETLIGAMRQGLGKSLLPRTIGNQISDIVEIPEYDNLPSRDMWILLRPELQNTKRARIIIEWLRGVLI